MTTRFHRLLNGRSSDQGMAMIITVGSMVILTSFALVLATTLVYDVKPVVQKREANQALSAARAGVTSTIAQIRSATTEVNGRINGDPSKLPCGSVAGTTSATGDEREYEVMVRYYTAHPSQQNAEWRDQHALPCTTGTTDVDAARYALIEARGSVGDITSNDTKGVEAVYVFSRLDRRNIGGLIRMSRETHYHDRETTWVPDDTCWQANQATAGAQIILAFCDETVPTLQRWHYRTDHHLALADTVNGDGSGGLCMTGTWAGSSIDLTLENCADIRSQKWFYNGYWRFQSMHPHQDSLVDYCVSTLPRPHMHNGRIQYWENRVGDRIVAAHRFHYDGPTRMCEHAPASAPENAVGAGNAGWPTNQLVNFGEYGRCMDIVGRDIRHALTIVFPCKAEPNDGTDWNQRFDWDGENSQYRHIKTVVRQDESPQSVRGAEYCLRGGDRAGDRAYFVSCSVAGERGAWTVHGKESPPELAYAIQNDANGLCLGLLPNSYAQVWSVLVSQPCEGLPEQRWNAEQLGSPAGVDSYREFT